MVASVSRKDAEAAEDERMNTKYFAPAQRWFFSDRAVCAHLAVLMLTSLFVPTARAENTLPRTAQTFEIGGHKAYLFAPPEPAAGKPWLWFAPTLKGVSLSQRKLYFETFLRAGIAIAGFDLGEVRGAPSSTAKFSGFYDEMVRRGWSPQPILLGQSRGGLMMLAWAVRNPDKVRAFVGIYPVCNLADWPLRNKAVTLADYGLTEAELMAQLSQLNPIDNLQGLVANRVPCFVVHGGKDAAVPYNTNTRLLKDRYEAGGGSITVKLVPDEGHQATAAFFECQELIDFVLTHAIEKGNARNGNGALFTIQDLPLSPSHDRRWLTWHAPASAAVILSNDVYFRNSASTPWLAGMFPAGAVGSFRLPSVAV
jgi:predicted esterase